MYFDNYVSFINILYLLRNIVSPLLNEDKFKTSILNFWYRINSLCPLEFIFSFFSCSMKCLYIPLPLMDSLGSSLGMLFFKNFVFIVLSKTSISVVFQHKSLSKFFFLSIKNLLERTMWYDNDISLQMNSCNDVK